MSSRTRTVPARETRPMSLRARSTSITCSARSFSDDRSSCSFAASSSSSRPRGRVPAIGCITTRPSSTRTNGSGDAPTSVAPPAPMRNMYGDGLMCRSARYSASGSGARRAPKRCDTPNWMQAPPRVAGDPGGVGPLAPPVATELVAKKVQRIRVVDRASAAAIDDRCGAVAANERRPREDANEGVPAHALAALDALQEKRTPERSQLRERGDRRLEIGKPLAHHRHQRSRIHLGRQHHRHVLPPPEENKNPRPITGRGLVVPPDLGPPSLADPQPPLSRSAPLTVGLRASLVRTSASRHRLAGSIRAAFAVPGSHLAPVLLPATTA